MEYPQRKPLRLGGYDYSQPGYYFITICTRERQRNVLCSLNPVGAAEGGGPYGYSCGNPCAERPLHKENRNIYLAAGLL